MPIMKNKKRLYKNSKIETRPLFTTFLITYTTCRIQKFHIDMFCIYICTFFLISKVDKESHVNDKSIQHFESFLMVQLNTCIACWAFGTLCPFPWISQHRTLLSHDPAIKNEVVVTDGGENRRQDIESSGGLVTSTSFIGLGWFPSPRLMPPPVLLPNPPVDPKDVWPNIFCYKDCTVFTFRNPTGTTSKKFVTKWGLLVKSSTVKTCVWNVFSVFQFCKHYLGGLTLYGLKMDRNLKIYQKLQLWFTIKKKKLIWRIDFLYIHTIALFPIKEKNQFILKRPNFIVSNCAGNSNQTYAFQVAAHQSNRKLYKICYAESRYVSMYY